MHLSSSGRDIDTNFALSEHSRSDGQGKVPILSEDACKKRAIARFGFSLNSFRREQNYSQRFVRSYSFLLLLIAVKGTVSN